MTEEPLQALLKVKRDIFPAHESFFDRFGDFGLPLGLSAFFLSAYQAFCCSGKREAVYPGRISPLSV